MADYNQEKKTDIYIRNVNRMQLSALYLALTGESNFRDKISHIESNYSQGICRETFYIDINEPGCVVKLRVEEKGQRYQELHYDIVFSVIDEDKVDILNGIGILAENME